MRFAANLKLMAAWLKTLQNLAGKLFGGCFLDFDVGLKGETAKGEGSLDSKDDPQDYCTKERPAMPEAHSFELETHILRVAETTSLHRNFDSDVGCDARLEACSWAAFGLAADEGP